MTYATGKVRSSGAPTSSRALLVHSSRVALAAMLAGCTSSTPKAPSERIGSTRHRQRSTSSTKRLPLEPSYSGARLN